MFSPRSVIFADFGRGAGGQHKFMKGGEGGDLHKTPLHSVQCTMSPYPNRDYSSLPIFKITLNSFPNIIIPILEREM